MPRPSFVSLSNQAARFSSEPPQLPVMTVVTPSSRKLSARGIALDVALDVRVDVDEAGRDHASRGIDGARRGRAGELSDGGDAAVLHRDVGGETTALPAPSITRALRIRTS